MKKGCLIGGVILGAILLVALAIGMWVNGIYNSLTVEENAVDKAWANVETDYQRRYDLIDNLVATVQGAADFERGTLTEVIEARSKATSINLSVDELTEENIAKFQQAQNELNQAFLGRMSFLQENYPQLTATQQFRDLSSQIEGTENRINVSRNRYNEAVNKYENLRETSPNIFVANTLGFTEKAEFKADAGAEKAPKVEFNK